VIERGRALTIGLNKWDGLTPQTRRDVERQIERKLDFVSFADVHAISALHGSGIAPLLQSAFAAYGASVRDLPTPRLNEILKEAVAANPPPVARGRRVRLRYAHQGGRRPPLIVVHGSQAERLPAHYRRFLANAFRAAFELRGTPLRVELKSGENPYAGKRNVLTRRQRRHKQRIRRHTRRSR
jgi:GTP-binding protein